MKIKSREEKALATESRQQKVCSDRLETTTVVDGALVLQEETEGPILDGQAELTLPEATSFEVGGGCDKLTVRAAGGKFRLAKVEPNNSQFVELGLGVLDRVEFKDLRHRI